MFIIIDILGLGLDAIRIKFLVNMKTQLIVFDKCPYYIQSVDVVPHHDKSIFSSKSSLTLIVLVHLMCGSVIGVK